MYPFQLLTSGFQIIPCRIDVPARSLRRGSSDRVIARHRGRNVSSGRQKDGGDVMTGRLQGAEVGDLLQKTFAHFASLVELGAFLRIVISFFQTTPLQVVVGQKAFSFWRKFAEATNFRIRLLFPR